MTTEYSKLFFDIKKYIKCECGYIILECRYKNHVHSVRHENGILYGTGK